MISDFGANITLTNGVSLQTKESYQEFIGIDKAITFSGNDIELCFEEDDFDNFIKKLESINYIEYVHSAYEHSQRVVRFYDLDKHIIEVGESIKMVCKRFSDMDMNIEQISKRMDIPINLVQKYVDSKK